MRRLVLSFVLAVSGCAGYQSLTVPSGASVNMTIPAVAPFTSMGDYRFAFRLHNWTLPGSGSVRIIQFPNFYVSLDSAGNLCGVNAGNDNQGSFSNQTCVSVTGLSDIVGRIQRFGATDPVHYPSPGSSWFEAQDLATGTVLAYTCGVGNWPNTGCPIDTAVATPTNGTAQCLGASVGFSLAWMKWFSTTVQPGSPFESETTAADLADFRFEDAFYTNQGTGGYAVTLATAGGSPSYGASPTENPVCQVPRQIFSIASFNQILQYDVALDSTGTLSHAWTQLSGPNTATIAGGSTASPSVSGTIFGSYVFQDHITDGSGHSSTCSVKDGFVVTDSSGMVVTGLANQDLLLGRAPPLTQNPWGWFDNRAIAEASLQINNLTAYYNLSGTPPWDTAGAGTITINTNTLNVVGTGTNFLTTFCPNAGSPPPQGSVIAVWYPSALARSGFGRRVYAVQSCADNTHLTLAGEPWNDAGLIISTACQAGHACQYAFVDGNVYGNWINNNSPADYYDNVAAFYTLFLRSGIDDYLNAARLLGDNYWELVLDSGGNFNYGEGFSIFPRKQSLLGMYLRALDGRPDMFAGLENIAGFHYQKEVQWASFFGNWTSTQGGYADTREEAYVLSGSAYCGLFDPNPTAAAACRSYSAYIMNHGWTPSRFPDGNFYTLYYAGSPASSWDSGTAISLTNGSPNGTCVTVTGSCNWTPGMFTPAAGPQVWWFTNSTTSAPRGTPYGNLDGDAVPYYPVRVDSTHLRLEDINGNPVNYQGTTGNHGWAVGTVQSQVGFGVQPYMYGILGMAFDFTAKEMACTAPGVPANCDNTVSANAHTYNVQTANYLRTTGFWPLTKGMYYGAGFIECGPGYLNDANQGCTAGNSADQSRVLNAEAIRSVMTAYAYNNDPALKTFADTLYTAMWGKPGYAVPAGLSTDNEYIWDYNDGFGFNMIGTPPSGRQPKYFGMGWGISAGSAWPWYRLGNNTPPPITPPGISLPVADDSTLKIAVNRLQTKLTSPIAATDTAINVLSIAGWQPNMLASIDAEIIEICGINTSAGKIQLLVGPNPTSCPNVSGRGFDSTAAASHITGPCASGNQTGCISRFMVAYDTASLRKEVEAIETALGMNLGNVLSNVGATPGNYCVNVSSTGVLSLSNTCSGGGGGGLALHGLTNTQLSSLTNTQLSSLTN